jgi:hypothetical protein
VCYYFTLYLSAIKYQEYSLLIYNPKIPITFLALNFGFWVVLRFILDTH